MSYHLGPAVTGDRLTLWVQQSGKAHEISERVWTSLYDDYVATKTIVRQTNERLGGVCSAVRFRVDLGSFFRAVL
jgi:hypothetical protein